MIFGAFGLGFSLLPAYTQSPCLKKGFLDLCPRAWGLVGHWVLVEH